MPHRLQRYNVGKVWRKSYHHCRGSDDLSSQAQIAGHTHLECRRPGILCCRLPPFQAPEQLRTPFPWLMHTQSPVHQGFALRSARVLCCTQYSLDHRIVERRCGHGEAVQTCRISDSSCCISIVGGAFAVFVMDTYTCPKEVPSRRETNEVIRRRWLKYLHVSGEHETICAGTNLGSILLY